MEKIKVSLDLHDWSVLNNRLDLLIKLKEHYPDFKVSLFTIPYDVNFEKQVEARILRKDTLKQIKKNLDWMEIIPHGLTHMDNEFEKCDYSTFNLSVEAMDEVFKKDGLPYAKGFCAPFWLWNKDVVQALDDLDWWGAIDRDQPEMLKTKKTYTYTHSLDEPFWKSNSQILNLHGHVDGRSKNDLEFNFVQLFKLPSNVEWHFASDFVV
jgi:hypothetical protein